MIVRGAFSSLLTPGLAKAMRAAVYGEGELTIEEFVKREEEMAILYPDTHKMPIWRRQPTRLEHPIKAWRIWGVQGEVVGEHTEWFISSVTADVKWEGPVLRADARPLDPKLWDKDKDALQHVFGIAGIHAWKTRDQAEEAIEDYGVSCFGELLLWGRVAQFTMGYRAEVCMIKKLYLRKTFEWERHRSKSETARLLDETANSLSRRYECEVEIV